MTDRDIGFVSFRDLHLRVVVEDGALREVDFLAKPGSEKSGAASTRQACSQLDEYFTGTRRVFELKLEPQGTEFQKKVWNALLRIPFGETRSYRQIAEAIGHPLAWRAVGQAANRNPIPIIIPCHRLVGAGGSLTGYAGGLYLKKRLLELEQGRLER
jgi:methylated-DNA-[protein]-cysteine S-methyltransferase